MLAGQHTVRDPVMKMVEGRDSHMKLSCVLYMHPCPHSHVLLQSYTYSLNNKPKPNPSSTVESREGSAFTEGVAIHRTLTSTVFSFMAPTCLFHIWNLWRQVHIQILKIYITILYVPTFGIYFVLNLCLSSRIKLCLYFQIFPRLHLTQHRHLENEGTVPIPMCTPWSSAIVLLIHVP